MPDGASSVGSPKVTPAEARERLRFERTQRLLEATETYVPGGVSRLHHKEAPTTTLVQSPLDDAFVLRAGCGDMEDAIRRLARGQVRGAHLAHSPVCSRAMPWSSPSPPNARQPLEKTLRHYNSAGQ
jgi:hypothetical protein